MANLGITKDQRRNQDFVNKTLGADKGYVAGSAASNLALLAAAEKAKANTAAAPAASPAASPAPAPAASPASAEDDQAKFDRLAAVAKERDLNANAKAYIDNLRKEYGNKDGNFMRAVGAQAIDPEGNPVYWKRGESGTDGSWQKLPSYHPATRQGWYSPEMVDALKRTGAVPSDDKFAADNRRWYEKTYKDAEGAIKLNLKEPTVQTDAEKVAASTGGMVSPPASAVQTSAKEAPIDNRNPAVAQALDAPGINVKKESEGWNPALMIDRGGQRVWDPTNISKALNEESFELADSNENIELHEMSTQLNLLAEELNEWSMSDRIHKDIPYSYSDAATDAGIAGLGALATYATGGLAAPVAGAATVARGGRLVNMLNKAYQGSKNVAKGAKEIATNPEVRAVANKNLPGVAATGVKTGTTSAGITTGLNAADAALDEINDNQATIELERIKKLSKG